MIRPECPGTGVGRSAALPADVRACLRRWATDPCPPSTGSRCRSRETGPNKRLPPAHIVPEPLRSVLSLTAPGASGSLPRPRFRCHCAESRCGDGAVTEPRPVVCVCAGGGRWADGHHGPSARPVARFPLRLFPRAGPRPIRSGAGSVPSSAAVHSAARPRAGVSLLRKPRQRGPCLSEPAASRNIL